MEKFYLRRKKITEASGSWLKQQKVNTKMKQIKIQLNVEMGGNGKEGEGWRALHSYHAFHYPVLSCPFVFLSTEAISKLSYDQKKSKGKISLYRCQEKSEFVSSDWNSKLWIKVSEKSVNVVISS